jgi:protein SCO1
MSKLTIRFFYGLTFLFIILAWWYGAQFIKEQQPLQSGLPYYGKDTSRAHEYMVRDFSFYNQDSVLITRQNFENKIWVSEFFFATCEGICPVMNMNLARIQDSFKSDTNLMFLSHTVDPETDDIARLKVYAEKHHYIKDKWHFVTGNAKTIYDLARTSYFSATPKDSSLGEDFVHSQLMCLVDPHLHIRGYYDGTNEKDMRNLIRDIRLLEIEYEKVYREKNWLFKLLD